MAKSRVIKFVIPAVVVFVVALIFILKDFMDETRAKSEVAAVMEPIIDNYNRKAIIELEEKYGKDIIKYYSYYLNDPCEERRLGSRDCIASFGKKSADIDTRRMVVLKLLQYVRDGKSGIEQSTIRSLWRFLADDFNEESKSIISELLTKGLEGKIDVYFSELILLVGVADMKSELPRLEKYFNDNKERFYERVKTRGMWEKNSIWYALCARARMGVKEDIEKCIELVESYPDEKYKFTFLFKSLSYVRQPEVVEYLKSYLFKDIVIPTVNIDTLDVRCSECAGWALYKMLEGFPSVRIEEQRKWMTEHTEWKIIR